MFWRKPRDVEFGSPRYKDKMSKEHFDGYMEQSRNADTSIVRRSIVIVGLGLALAIGIYYLLRGLLFTL